MKIRLIRNVKKMKKLLLKNKSRIKRVIVSEDFIDKLSRVPAFVDIEEVADDDNDIHEWLLYGIPMRMSRFIGKNCILEMKDGTYVVLKGI